MKTRIRRRIATATMVLASLGAGTTTAVLVSAGSAAPGGAAAYRHLGVR
jgi:microcompartment protein CcmK/EutM